MKYKVRGQELEREKEVEFWLEEMFDGDITLRARKEAKVSSWDICRISSKGLYITPNIEEDLGFPKDERDRIKLDE